MTDSPSEEVDIERNFKPWNTLRDDGEECGAAGNDHDDEEGRDAGTELAIVVIFAG